MLSILYEASCVKSKNTCSKSISPLWTRNLTFFIWRWKGAVWNFSYTSVREDQWHFLTVNAGVIEM